jgi:hypothetical protein
LKWKTQAEGLCLAARLRCCERANQPVQWHLADGSDACPIFPRLCAPLGPAKLFGRPESKKSDSAKKKKENKSEMLKDLAPSLDWRRCPRV